MLPAGSTRLSYPQTHQQSGEQGPNQLSWVRGLICVLTLLALCATILTVPQTTWKTGEDSSWGAVLTYAREKNLQFGTDVAFTYGPLGFLALPYFSPDNVWWSSIVNAALCGCVAAAVCLLAFRLNALWRCLVLGTFIFVVANAHAGVDLLLDIGLLGWGLLCLVENGWQLRLSVFALIALAVFGTLVKMTYLFTAGWTLCLISCDLVLREKRRTAISLMLGAFAGFLVGWCALQQDLGNLVTFVIRSLKVCGGYAAMGFTPAPRALLSGLLVGALALAILGLRAGTAFHGSERNLKWRRGLLLVWLSGLLFISWKHGFVRADRAHVELFAFFVPVVLLLLEAVNSRPGFLSEGTRLLSATCCVAALLTLFAPSYLQVCLLRPAYRLAENIQTLTALGNYQRHMTAMFEAERRHAQLPTLDKIIGNATVDVFGNDQVYAVFNHLNYHPRPVFQGYAAYSSALMELNEQFYRSPGRPDYVLFKLDPIDKRFPPLEDALVLRDLLVNYEAVAVEGPFVLLRTNRSAIPKLKLLRSGTVYGGNHSELADYNANGIWLQLDLKPTLFGKLRQGVYRPPEVRLEVLNAAAQPPAEFLAPASMLSSGFLASPLVVTNADLVNLYRGTAPQRPKAYSVYLSAGTERLWEQPITFRIYAISDQLAPCSNGHAGKGDLPAGKGPWRAEPRIIPQTASSAQLR